MKFNIFKKQKEMKKSWDDKANINAYHWVDSTKINWKRDDYYKKGEKEVKKYIIDFLISKGFSLEELKQMRALDIGCGTGRIVRAMAKYFGLIKGVDVSKEMIKKAKIDNSDLSNIDFSFCNGSDLNFIKDSSLDFVFSFIVFQHIPDRNIVNNYLKEIKRILKKNGFLKIQVRGHPGRLSSSIPSWRYKGFNNFYIALSRKKKIPFPVIRKYNTVHGCFYKPKELKKIASQIGFKKINIFFDQNNYKYLWLESKK